MLLTDEGRFEVGEFSVWQDFKDGTRECVRLRVSAEQAVLAAKHYTESVGARLGFSVRVYIVDGDDFVNFEWKYDEGIVFPKQSTSGIQHP